MQTMLSLATEESGATVSAADTKAFLSSILPAAMPIASGASSRPRAFSGANRWRPTTASAVSRPWRRATLST